MARFPDGWVLLPHVGIPEIKDGQMTVDVGIEEKELVMCKHCMRRWTSMCMAYKGGQETADDWYCADGEEDNYEDQEADDE